MEKRDAARLACACRRFRPTFKAAWAAGAFQPIRGSDGMMKEPPGGRFCLEVAEGEDVQMAVDRCPPGVYHCACMCEHMHVHLWMARVVLRAALHTGTQLPPGKKSGSTRDLQELRRALLVISAPALTRL